MADYVLGLDAGSTVYKAAIFDQNGRELSVVGRSLAPVIPRPGWVERPLDTAWPTMCAVIREAVTLAGIRASEIACVGSTGHGNGLYVLDGHGRAVRDGIASLDTRAHEIVAAWRSEGRSAEMRAHTNQALWPGQPNALLAWMKRYEPDRYSAIRSVLMVTDYLNYQLTGTLATSVSMMSGTGLMDVFSGSYDRGLLDLYGIGEVLGALPEAHESHEIIGVITDEAAASTGLVPGTPVAAGLYDIDGSAIGAGVISPGQTCVIAGTWSINEVITVEPIRDESLLMAKRFAVPGLWVNIDASAASTANMDWFVNEFMGRERQDAEERGSTVFDVCDALVGGVDPSTSTVLFHPFLFGSDTQSNARAGFYGIAGWHTKAHLLRALYEGVVFGHRVHVDRLRAAGAPVGAIRLTGGGSRSKVLSAMFADVLSTDVEVPAASEVGALGAAMVAGVGVGLYRDVAQAVSQVVRIGGRYSPSSESRSYYDDRYAAYCELLAAMSRGWDLLSGLGGTGGS